MNAKTFLIFRCLRSVTNIFLSPFEFEMRFKMLGKRRSIETEAKFNILDEGEKFSNLPRE